MSYRIWVMITGCVFVFVAGYLNGAGYSHLESGTALALGFLQLMIAVVELEKEPHKDKYDQFFGD